MRFFVQIVREFPTALNLVGILKTVPVSQDSKEYAKCKLGEFVHNKLYKTFI